MSQEVKLAARDVLEVIEIPNPRLDEPSWGKVELPEDGNSRDNEAYFAIEPEVKAPCLVIAETGELRSVFQLACAPWPDESAEQSSVEFRAPDDLTGINWTDYALVICQMSDVPMSVEGVALSLPSLNDSYTEEALWVDQWERREGPLADTPSGRALAVESVTVNRYVNLSQDLDYQVLAKFTNGTPFLTRHEIDHGWHYQCATLPLSDWSNFGEGIVLVPLIQRLLEKGKQRLANVTWVECGSRALPDADGRSLHHKSATELGLEKGVFESNGKWRIYGLPLIEAQSDSLGREEIKALFDDILVEEFRTAGIQTTQTFGEWWRALLVLLLLFLVLETLLTMPARWARATEVAA